MVARPILSVILSCKAAVNICTYVQLRSVFDDSSIIEGLDSLPLKILSLNRVN